MATSESDDFESADEELGHDTPLKKGVETQQWSSPNTIGSESDDDTEYVPRTPRTNTIYSKRADRDSLSRAAAMAAERTLVKNTVNTGDNSSIKDPQKTATDEKSFNSSKKTTESMDAKVMDTNVPETESSKTECVLSSSSKEKDEKESTDQMKVNATSEDVSNTETRAAVSRPRPRERGKLGNLKKAETSRPAVKKLGTRIVQNNNVEPNADATPKIDVKDISAELEKLSVEELLVDEWNEPEEMKLNKKFKEVFKPDGWEGLGEEIELPDELTDEKLQPILDRISSAGYESENYAGGGWGDWSNWGVSSLLNTATAGVSTLTSHVSHGLTLLEETIGVPDPTDLVKSEEQETPVDDGNKVDVQEESQLYTSFGFGNLMSGVSSITKLVESTSTKVMTGGLDTLEAIGKKTMEVLQEGDPGLKKKRAFFSNETEKPILSHILREAKEKAEAAEKTQEEKQKARKVHFESLFDDYQGLVHLEALEMLSKQSNIKIQQHLVGLDTNELNSIEETLEEVKELCDLGEEDGNEENNEEKDLKCKLEEACKDLGINISYEKLYTVWEECQLYLAPSEIHTDQEIFQCAISTLAQFTALSVERFHKTAELLLIKEHRSTVNEADALVQLTRILSNHVEVLASLFCSPLNELVKTSEVSTNVTANITTIFMEASNASSYIQDAFRLLIPIIQVGAI